jgi:ApaG protein
VVGDGVVGEQPRLRPGERFEYTSSTFFKTPYGTMEGAYVMRADDGAEFEAPIPQFVLCIPRMLH